LAEFPFVEKIDRSVALSGILTAFDRRAMATAPLHAFTSPIAGTGKSLLVDIASILTSGELAPVISQGKTEEELEKRLGAALIGGDPIISLDNCDRELSSAFLCQALTQQRLKIRLLGYSRHVDVPINSAFFATGNNLEISNDLTRRTLLCQLDAGVERPELRSFKSNVLEVARDQRGRLVAAILTILRAWNLGCTAIGITPLGSFEDWSFRVRSPLLWLDRDDPCDSIATVRESDPCRSLLNTVLVQWEQKLGTTNSYTVQQVIQRTNLDQNFFGAIVAVAASAQGGSISNDRLGRWLSKNNGKIVNQLKLLKTGIVSGYPLWRVNKV
jgi:putative DNA primase/helicase